MVNNKLIKNKSVNNHFEKGPDSWCSYDYHGSVVSETNNFILATHEKNGGVNDSGYIWVDQTRWSADTPESPISILPLIFYRNWVNTDSINLLDANISVYLRGDNLQLDGAQCYFWVLYNNTRWHYTDVPLVINENEWTNKPHSFSINPEESKWNNSWSIIPNQPESLLSVIKNCESYGFSLVGFKQEPRGRISMDEFSINF
mgnify:FL=1